MEDFVMTLRRWYAENKRDLPWRNTPDPYYIWLSEIILQQTRVNQGLPYYLKFIENFPDVSSLASASEDQVLKLWQGLGYYSRARNLHHAAKQIVNFHEGKFPGKYDEILALKGIGDYTAAAIASFAFGQPYPVVDGNVFRFLARFSGNQTSIDTTTGKKEFSRLALELLDREDPGNHNQAMMEIGATVCLPVNPRCSLCPFQGGCVAFQEDQIEMLPLRTKKTNIRHRYLHYLVYLDGDHTWIRKRSGKDIWTGLYEFPLIETESNVIIDRNAIGLHAEVRFDISKEYRHILSHQKLITRFYIIDSAPDPSMKEKGYFSVQTCDLVHFAMPQLLVKFLRHDPVSPVLTATVNN